MFLNFRKQHLKAVDFDCFFAIAYVKNLDSIKTYQNLDYKKNKTYLWYFIDNIVPY